MIRLTTIALIALAALPPGEPARDIRDLIVAARGAPAALCALAANGLGNYGGGSWSDAPATPLARPEPRHRGREWHGRASVEDVRFLLESLSTEDGCVRELAVRLLAYREGE